MERSDSSARIRRSYGTRLHMQRHEPQEEQKGVESSRHPTKNRRRWWWWWSIRAILVVLMARSGTRDLSFLPRSSLMTSISSLGYCPTRSILAAFASLLNLVAPSAAAESARARPPKQNEYQYGGDEPDESSWRDWDYYRILGLDAGNSGAITAAEVRQAYRVQAKRHHPDKVRNRNNTDNLSQSAQPTSAADSKHSVDEANARFAKIAEAYEVLSKDDTREEYDRYLRAQQQSHYHDDYPHFTDGWAEFDGFYDHQPHGSRHEPTYAWDLFDEIMQEWWDPTAAHFSTTSSYFQQQQQQQAHAYGTQYRTNQHPAHLNLHEMQLIREEQATFVDPRTGWEILRVAQTFQSSQSSQWRIIQDFVEEWDPYTHQWLYRPISDPVIEPMRSSSGGFGQSANPMSESDLDRHHPSLLWPEEGVPEGSHLEQAPYVATVEDCQLRILQQDPPSHEDGRDELYYWNDSGHQLVWSSPAVAHPRDTSCQLLLLGSRLVVASAATGRVYWSSRPDDGEDDEFLRASATYVARLDTDATLTVYRLDTGSLTEMEGQPLMTWFRDVLLPRMLRVIWPVLPGEFVAGPIQMMMLRTPLMGNNGAENALIWPWQWRCVDSTGPAKCWKLGRLLTRSFKVIDRWVRRILSSL